MKNRSCCFLMTFLLVTQVFATPAKPAATLDNFAFSLNVTPQQQDGLYEFPIPALVYQNVVYPQLSDLRLFNAKGEQLPLLIRPYPKSHDIKRVKLSVFPVKLDQKNQNNNLSLQVVKQPDGTVIQVHTKSKKAKSLQFDYLIDLTTFKERTINKLSLEWHSANKNTWIKHFKLLGSNDLQRWQDISKGVLAQLAQRNRLIKHNIIEIPTSRHYQYLVIKLNGTDQALQLKNIMADISTVQPFSLQWTGLKPSRIQPEKNTIFYDSHAFYPVQKIRFLLPVKNYSGKVRIYTRRDDKQPWRFVKTTVIYHVKANDQHIKQLDITIPVRRQPLWKIVMHPFVAAKVKIALGWHADQALFVATGIAPYQLAFGSHAINFTDGQSADSIRLLLRKHGDLTTNQPNVGQQLQTLAGKTALHPASPLTYQQIILWLTLIFGVCLLSGMAWYLWQQQKE